MIRKIWILIFTAIPLLSMGQKTISDWIELNDLKHPEFKAINLFVQKEDKKILVEKIELNNKCLILRKAEYCNFLYEPLDSIEREIYEYDNSDTLLISGMLSVSPASISLYLDREVLRIPFQAILPTLCCILKNDTTNINNLINK